MGELAIITEKYGDGRSKAVRTTAPLSPALRKQAERLDSHLHKKMQQLESRLIAADLLDETIPPAGAPKSKGSVALWHAVGAELVRLAKEAGIKGTRERRWLWEAIDNLHATERLRRAGRGRTRLHFEYCYRLAQFPGRIAGKMYWSEWVYFFDSLTVREEPRADDWLHGKLQSETNVDRKVFRRFTENLNRQIRKMDTSVLSRDELFALYGAAWTTTGKELKAASRTTAADR